MFYQILRLTAEDTNMDGILESGHSIHWTVIVEVNTEKYIFNVGVKMKVPCAWLIKPHAMKTYGGVQA
jgi:hypothetical protein